MGLFNALKEKAIADRQRIVLPESTEPRTLQAANQVIAEGIADVILIGEPEKILEQAAELNLTHINQATIVNPTTTHSSKNMPSCSTNCASQKA